MGRVAGVVGLLVGCSLLSSCGATAPTCGPFPQRAGLFTFDADSGGVRHSTRLPWTPFGSNLDDKPLVWLGDLVYTIDTTEPPAVAAYSVTRGRRIWRQELPDSTYLRTIGVRAGTVVALGTTDAGRWREVSLDANTGTIQSQLDTRQESLDSIEGPGGTEVRARQYANGIAKLVLERGGNSEVAVTLWRVMSLRPLGYDGHYGYAEAHLVAGHTAIAVVDFDRRTEVAMYTTLLAVGPVAGHRVLRFRHNAQLQLVDAATGAVQWERRVHLKGPAIVLDGRYLLLSREQAGRDTTVVALNLDTGAVLARGVVHGAGRARLVGLTETDALLLLNKSVTRIDASTGRTRWQRAMSIPPAAAALVGNTIVVHASDPPIGCL